MTIAKDSSVLIGRHVDGREGALLTKIAQGELLAVPFYNVQFGNSGGASIAYGSRATDNPTPGKPVNVSIPAGAQGYAYLRTQLWGRVIGLRMRRHFANALPPITLIIDGEPFTLRDTNTRLDTVPTVFSSFDGASYWIAADDLLTDGPHTVTLMVTGDATTAVASLALFGWLVEKAKGYGAYPPDLGNAWATQALTTTATTINNSGFSSRELVFYNSGATARTVSLLSGATVLQTVAVPAGGTAKMTAPQPWPLGSYKLMQDVGTDVLASWLPEGFTQ